MRIRLNVNGKRKALSAMSIVTRTAAKKGRVKLDIDQPGHGHKIFDFTFDNTFE